MDFFASLGSQRRGKIFTPHRRQKNMFFLGCVILDLGGFSSAQMHLDRNDAS
jgi:hypothetical protein